MRSFQEVYGKRIVGTISGWDRIRFRGTVRWLASTRGINSFLTTQGILLKDFGAWAERITKGVRRVCEEQAKRLAIPMHYLRSSKDDKEALAREIAAKRGIEQGDICILSVVEPCNAPLVVPNRSTKKLEIAMARESVFGSIIIGTTLSWVSVIHDCRRGYRLASPYASMGVTGSNAN